MALEQGWRVQWAHDKKLFPDKVVKIVHDCQLVVSLGGDRTLLGGHKKLLSIQKFQFWASLMVT